MSGERVAIVGAGLMGHGLAQVFATAGLDVVVYDPVPSVLAGVCERIAGNLRELGLPPDSLERISIEKDLTGAVDAVDWVFEAAPERLDLKQQLFEQMDAVAPAHAILASNTSAISITEIAARATHRERIVGTHWWNPPFLIPLVEVIQAADTNPAVVTRTIQFLARMGKVPVHVHRDIPGFIGNRLQHAMWREAFNLIDAGVCDADAVDTVVKQSFGLRLPVLGPIENAELIGLDLTLDIHSYILPRLEPPSDPSPGLRDRVARGQLGMRTGSGFRDWTDEEAEQVRARLRAHLVATTHPDQA